jgi:hypothetical protein
MRNRRSVTGLIAAAMAAGVVAAGAAAATPDTYHDMKSPTMTGVVVAEDSATTPVLTPDTYHDM